MVIQPAGFMTKRSPGLFDSAPEQRQQKQPHEVSSYLTAHEFAFLEKYQTPPARYTDRDAKHAKDLIKHYGYTGALVMLKRFFKSRDPFVAGSGHALSVLASSTIQNKLIAEASRVDGQPQQFTCTKCKRVPVEKWGNYCSGCKVAVGL